MPLFVVYAPDYTDPKANERRLIVRESHLAKAKLSPALKIGGAMISPNEALDAPDTPRKMVGSVMIIDCENFAEAEKMIKTDIYWTGDVWDKEKTTIQPFVSATPL